MRARAPLLVLLVAATAGAEPRADRRAVADRLSSDPAAVDLALDLFDSTGTVLALIKWTSFNAGAQYYLPGLDGRLPLVVAIVELAEGVRILGNILNVAPEEVAIGQRVEVAWDRLGGDVAYPAFNVI